MSISKIEVKKFRHFCAVNYENIRTTLMLKSSTDIACRRAANYRRHFQFLLVYSLTWIIKVVRISDFGLPRLDLLAPVALSSDRLSIFEASSASDGELSIDWRHNTCSIELLSDGLNISIAWKFVLFGVSIFFLWTFIVDQISIKFHNSRNNLVVQIT